MDLKRIRANIKILIDRVWMFAESFESKDIRKVVNDIMELIKEAE